MTVKIKYVHLGHIIGGEVRRSLVLNTNKFSDAAGYCKDVQGTTARAVQLDKGVLTFEVDTPDEVHIAVEVWAAASYPGASVYYMPFAVSDKPDAEGVAYGSI